MRQSAVLDTSREPKNLSEPDPVREPDPERSKVPGQPSEWAVMLVSLAALTLICLTVVVVVWMIFVHR